MPSLIQEIRAQLAVAKGKASLALRGDAEEIPYATIDAIPASQQLTQIGPGIRYKRLPDMPGLQFFQIMEPRSVYNKHVHGDCVEVITVTSGTLIELTTGEVLGPGRSISYAPGEARRDASGTRR